MLTGFSCATSLSIDTNRYKIDKVKNNFLSSPFWLTCHVVVKHDRQLMKPINCFVKKINQCSLLDDSQEPSFKGVERLLNRQMDDGGKEMSPHQKPAQIEDCICVGEVIGLLIVEENQLYQQWVDQITGVAELCQAAEGRKAEKDRHWTTLSSGGGKDDPAEGH